MQEQKYIYGPVPSRRLGISLGISPIPKKTCNYSCIYCQLGRTDHLTNTRKMFFSVEEIVAEFDRFIKHGVEFDVVTIVGEGEPTLYLGLGELIKELKKRTNKPIAVITNGALLYDKEVRDELGYGDIVLPTIDAYDEQTFKKINRPFGKIHYDMIKKGLEIFSKEFKGQLWIELMLMAEINDDDESLKKYSETLKSLKYDRLYINTPVRPPTEPYVKAITHENMEHAVDVLGGISIDLLESKGFYSGISDHFEAIMSIIKRHPMNQYEIQGFLQSRGCKNYSSIIEKLSNDNRVSIIKYKGYVTYRLK